MAMGQWANFKAYVVECTQLLYQIYFKPYTLRRRLQDIHPDLDITTNPFQFKAEFAENPRLERYAEQTWWLTAVVPVVAILIVAPLYSLFAESSFDFAPSGLFLLGWWAGVWLARGVSGKWSDRLTNLFLILFGLILLFSIGSRIAPDFISMLTSSFASSSSLLPLLRSLSLVAIGVAIGVAAGVAAGVAIGVAAGVAIGVAAGVANGVMLGAASGVATGVVLGVVLGVAVEVMVRVMIRVAIGVVLGVVLGVAIGVVLGVVLGVMVRVAVGVVLGVTVGVAVVLGVLRVYFWLPEFVWLLLLNFTVGKGNAAQYLRWLPPYFDQLIYLPLPFMSDLIIKAHRTHSLVARRTIDYFTNFTNQQPVAARAMLGIAFETLDRCRSAGDIAASGSQLDWILQDEDSTFGSAFPQLLTISQSINAAYQATSPYRRLELIEQPLRQLQTLRNTLAFGESAKFATAFGPIAERWQQILEDSRTTLAEAARNSPEIPNRYIPGNPLDPATSQGRFKGRQDLFHAIEEISLSPNPPVWLLYGRRRTGKTSALRYLPDRVGGDLIPLLVDCQKIATSQKLANMAQIIANGMVETARTARNLKLSPIDSHQLESDPFVVLQAWMESIEQRFPHKRFLLCLDEFERLQEAIAASNSRIPLNFLRNVMQHRKQWVLLFSGSHNLSELEPYWSDYLIGTRTLRLTYLNTTEAQELIRHPVADFPDIYDDKAVDAILHLTHCQPYFIQLVCSALVERLNSQNRRRVTVEDVESIPDVAIERADGYFNEFLGTLTHEHRNLLTRLIRQEPFTEQDRPLLPQLTQMEVLNRIAANDYQFQIPLIQKFVESTLFDRY